MHSIADIRRQRCPAKRAGRVRYVPRNALRERAPGLASIGNLGLRLGDSISRSASPQFRV